MSVIVFLGLCAVLAGFDWKRRTVPRIVPIVGTVLAGALAVSLPVLVTGSVIGFVIALVADLPMGDVAVGAMLGAWLGAEDIILVWIVALLIGNMIWAAWEDRFINWPGEWPFTPLLLVPACAMVLIKGGW
jgi:hypothetical protein